MDRFDSDTYNLQESGIKIAFFVEEDINPELNQFTVYQTQPCETNCNDRKVRVGVAGLCDEDRIRDIDQYQVKYYGQEEGVKKNKL